MQTKDLTEENVEKIAQLFPSCVTEAVSEDGSIKRLIDFEALKRQLSGDIIPEGKERYVFTWPGKSEAQRLGNTPTTLTLRPCREKSVNFDDTKNVYIEGDNLNALKLLRETYLGKIKMIYIDPPYNTGNDFVYRDDFSMSLSDYEKISGDYDEDNNKLILNLSSNGRFHSDWLNMMIPRVLLSKDLLTEDGVLLISIDDNEQSSLSLLLKQVFGDSNVETLIWNKEAEGSSGALKQISTFRRIHEYIICAYKNRNCVQFNKIHEALKGRENEFQTANLAVNEKNEHTDHPNYFTLTSPSGDVFTRQWKWSKKEIQELIDNNLIYWGSDGHKQPRLIIPTDDRRTTFLLSILNYGGTTIGRKDFESVMGGDIEFDYPKPLVLLEKLIESCTGPNDIIMDYFSGSGTTGQAIFNVNSRYGSSRQFILVQLPQLYDEDTFAFKHGFVNISDVARQRLIKAGNNLKCSLSSGLVDIGFRTFIIDSSNMNDVYYDPQSIKKDILDYAADNIKSDRTGEDLLFQVMLELGIELSVPITKESIAGKDVISADGNYLIACFDDDVDEVLVTEIAKRKPYYAVFRDSSMSSDAVAINFGEIFKTYSPDTKTKVL